MFMPTSQPFPPQPWTCQDMSNSHPTKLSHLSCFEAEWCYIMLRQILFWSRMQVIKASYNLWLEVFWGRMECLYSSKPQKKQRSRSPELWKGNQLFLILSINISRSSIFYAWRVPQKLLLDCRLKKIFIVQFFEYFQVFSCLYKKNILIPCFCSDEMFSRFRIFGF